MTVVEDKINLGWGGGPQYLLKHFIGLGVEVKADPTGIYIYETSKGYWHHYKDDEFCTLLAATYQGIDIWHRTKSGKGKQRLDISANDYLKGVAKWCYSDANVRDDRFFEGAKLGYACRNGFVEFAESGISFMSGAHKEAKARIFLDFDYDVAALCPNTMKFVDSYFVDDDEGEDKKRAMFEAFGFAITGTSTFDNRGFMMWFTGKKGSGKTTLVDTLLPVIVPPERTTSVSPANFADPNALNLLRGMLANFADDVHGKNIFKDILATKTLVSGMPVTVKALYNDKAQVRMRGVAYFCTANEMPPIYDPSGALQSRMIEVHINPFKGEFRVPEELRAEVVAERAGIMNLVHKHYYERLQREKQLWRVWVPPTSKEFMDMSMEGVDAVGDQIMQYLEFDPESRLEPRDLWAAWNHFKAEEGLQIGITKSTYLHAVRRRFPKCYDGKTKSNGTFQYFLRWKKDFTYVLDNQRVDVRVRPLKVVS